MKDVDIWFDEHEYMLSFGPQGFILTGNGYSFMATIEDIDVGIEEMLFMREDSGEGITIYEDEEY